MKKENNIILGVLIGIGLIAVFAFVFTGRNRYTPNTQAGDQETNQDIDIEDQGMNPDYADLTEEQVRIADQAIGDLLNSSQGITPPMITVQSFEEREFSDASLGCPDPDQMYAQVITPGYQVILEAQGQTYDYRISGETVKQCEAGNQQ